MNRESWLTAVAEQLAPLFPCGLKGKKYRVTCGWPSVGGLGAKARRVGECHSHESSKGKVHEIFISPFLDDPVDVAGTLAHELAHVAAGIKAAHGKEFVRVCKAVGLTDGRPKNVGPGPLLVEQIKGIIKPLPEYPHKSLAPVRAAKKAGGSVGLVCTAQGCGCKVQIGASWLDKIPSLPTCGCGSPFARKDG
jgi:hypothetical protein